MPRSLAAFANYQVFLNYLFDEKFFELADATNCAVVASGLLSVCAYDLTTPDRPWLDMLVEAIQYCRYSAHEFSRPEGEGDHNFARMNMPLEMGMALFYALQTQREKHGCLFFVATAHDYQAFASDLAGLDPKVHNNDARRIVIELYDWLRNLVNPALFSSQATIKVVERFEVFTTRRDKVRGAGTGGRPSHEEIREVMYQVCAGVGWWDWRANKAGKDQFPPVPLAVAD